MSLSDVPPLNNEKWLYETKFEMWLYWAEHVIIINVICMSPLSVPNFADLVTEIERR